jgi:hypothetical protein
MSVNSVPLPPSGHRPPVVPVPPVLVPPLVLPVLELVPVPVPVVVRPPELVPVLEPLDDEPLDVLVVEDDVVVLVEPPEVEVSGDCVVLQAAAKSRGMPRWRRMGAQATRRGTSRPLRCGGR